jgi:hypothetical protein
MTQKLTGFKALLLTALAASGLFAAHANAKDKATRRSAAYTVLSQERLDNGKTTDLFLRNSRNGREFLYLASANGTLSIFDVTDPKEPRPLQSLVLVDKPGSFQIRPVNNRVAIASGAVDPAENLTVLDLSNAPSTEIAKQLKTVDAYTIDGAGQIVYVAQRGTLVVLQFDHPITREAEIWEQSFETR